MPSVVKEEPTQASPGSRRSRAAAKNSANKSHSASSSTQHEQVAFTHNPTAEVPQQDQQGEAANNSHPRSNATDSRFRRSEAPTVTSSRLHHQRPNSVAGTETVGASDVRLQEIRPRAPEPPMITPDGPHQMSFTDSFVSNGLPLKDIDEKFTAFNNVLGELQHLGIQHVANLPELVLVGDQSAGKSSLMSAIAGLSLPRSGGTCTRCPIHIRLSKRPRWSCQVRLQIDYLYDPPADTEIQEDDVSDECPFPPWFPQTREVIDFMTIDDKNDTGLIEKALSWAQIAILNPTQDYKRFIPGSGDLARNMNSMAGAALAIEAKFSPNVIALEIQGPGLADLSFYDLPGLIVNTSDGEDEYLIKVVENLTKQYINHEKAIIIWAVPMTADPQTSSTFTVIRKANALNRCIGVMTKADLLPPGSHTQWIEMLEGKRHKVNLGYFITSRRSIGSGPINLENEHKAEEAFFNGASDKIWPREFRNHEERCGVERLKRYLIELLSQAFRTSLPELKFKLSGRLKSIKKELAGLPELPPNPEAVIRTNLARFEENLIRQMQSQDFAAKWSRIAEKFRDVILYMKPKYKLHVGAQASTDAGGGDDFEILSVRSSNNSPRFGIKRQASVDHYAESLPASQRRRGANGFIKNEDGSTHPVTPSRPRGAPMQSTPGTGRQRNGIARPGAPSMTLEDVRELILKLQKPGMPNTVPDEVKVQLCMRAIRFWQEPLDTLLENSMMLLQDKLLAILRESLGNLRNRQIYKVAYAHIESFVSAQRIELGSQLARLYKIESYQLYTLDNETCGRHELAERRILAHTRHHLRYKAYLDKADDPDYPKPAVWAALTEEQRASEEARMVKESAKMGRDPYSTELDVAAYVRGYYLTAAWRFIDSACLNFTSALLPDVAPSMISSMNAELGIDSPDEGTWKGLMEEDLNVANRRRELQTEEGTFENALRKISELEMDIHNTNGGDLGVLGDLANFGAASADVVDLSMSDVE